MQLMTKEEFIEYIETNDIGCTLADFADIDIDDLIQRLRLTKSFLKSFLDDYDMDSLIESYEFKRIYPNHPLLTSEELFDFIKQHDVDLSAEDFEGIDVDDFIKYAYLTKHPKIKDSSVIESELADYKQRLEYQSAPNYAYLFTTEYETLEEADIANIVRLYLSAWIGDADGGEFGYWFVRLFDFEENTCKLPSAGYGSENSGIYILGFTPVYDLPDNAYDHICGLLKESDVVKIKQTKYPDAVNVEGNWHLCIELKDGRIIRYSGVSNPPTQFSRFAQALYGYVIVDLR